MNTSEVVSIVSTVIEKMSSNKLQILENDYEGLVVCKDKNTIRFIQPVVNKIGEPCGFDSEKPDRKKLTLLAEKYLSANPDLVADGSCIRIEFDHLRVHIHPGNQYFVQWYKNILGQGEA